MSANHNGNFQIAKDTIYAMKESGANAVKLQTYTADTLTLDCKKEDFIVNGGTLWDGRTLYDLYKEAYTPWEWHEELFKYAKSLDLEIFSSPFDKSAVDFLEQFNPPAYKIASFEITDYDLIEYVAKKQKPIIISTGIALKEEIEDVVNICKTIGNNQIILLKCTSQYPAPLNKAHLKTIPKIKNLYDVEVGFSDHTVGYVAPIVAVTLGAVVIEKHFILDKSIGGADCEFSMDAKNFKNMVKAIRETEQLLNGVDDFKDEKDGRRFCRSIYVCKDIKKGDILSENNLKSVRPGYGMHPKFLKDILGTKAKKDYKFGDRFEK
jgi:pseudaminic acid synthase